MNESAQVQNKGVAGREPTPFDRNLNRMREDLHELRNFSEVLKRHVTDRLDNICSRINSTDYSKNNGMSALSESPNIGKPEKPVPFPAGILGEWMQTNEEIRKEIESLLSKTMQELDIAVSFLEQHI